VIWSYDGVSVMSGAFSIVQTKVRVLTLNSCQTCRFNLVEVDVAKNIHLVGKIVGLLKAIYVFFT
jgi:hypothetical protein